MGINRRQSALGHSRRQRSRHYLSRRGFTLTGMLLAVALCGLVLGVYVAFRDATNPRNVLSHGMFSADGTQLGLVYLDGSAEVFDTATGARNWHYAPADPQERWNGMWVTRTGKLSLDGLRLASCNVVDLGQNPKSVIHVWDGPENRETQHTSINGWIHTLEISSDGAQVAFNIVGTVAVSLLDVATGQVTTLTPAVLLKWAAIYDLDYSPDGKQLAILGEKGGQAAIAVFDIPSGATTEQLVGLSSYGSTIKFSPDGRTIVAPLSSTTPGVPDELCVLDGEGFQRMRSVVPAFAYISEIDFSPDSAAMFVQGETSTAFRLDTLLLTDAWKLTEGESIVAPGVPLAAAREDSRLVLYDTSTCAPTGVAIPYGVGPWRLLLVLAGFFVWFLCFAIHRYGPGRRMVCRVCGKSKRADKQSKDICSACSLTFLSVSGFWWRVGKGVAALLFAFCLMLIPLAATLALWIYLAVALGLAFLAFAWIYLRVRRNLNSLIHLDTAPPPTVDGAPPVGARMEHWSIDSAGAVRLCNAAAAHANRDGANHDEVVRSAVAHARAEFARLLGHEFDFSPGVKVTSVQDLGLFHDLLQKVGARHSRSSAVYVLRPVRRVLFCEAEARRQMFDIQSSIRAALSYCLFDTRAARRTPAWLRTSVNHLVAFGADEKESRRLNCAVRACLTTVCHIGPAMFTMSLQRLIFYSRQSNNFEAYTFMDQFTSFSASLAEYLTTDAPPELQAGFLTLVRDAQAGNSDPRSISRRLKVTEDELLAKWRTWVESRTREAPTPTAEQEATIQDELAPIVRNPQAPFMDRLQAIRALGERGFLCGAVALGDVAQNPREDPDLKRAAEWSLRMLLSAGDVVSTDV